METAVIGAVGPEICVLVPPKSEAKNPIKMAPYNPASGPRPDCTPKAKASGSATIPAVIPPNRFPLKLEIIFLFIIIGFFSYLKM